MSGRWKTKTTKLSATGGVQSYYCFCLHYRTLVHLTSSKSQLLFSFLNIQLCYLVSLQRYTKALSSVQRASLVEKSRQKPRERIKVITDVSCCTLDGSDPFSLRFCTLLEFWQAVRDYSYDDDPLLVACGISIEKQLIQMNGRVLEAPKVASAHSLMTASIKIFNFFSDFTLLSCNL